MCMYEVLECIFLLRLIKTKQALLYVILFFLIHMHLAIQGKKQTQKERPFSYQNQQTKMIVKKIFTSPLDCLLAYAGTVEAKKLVCEKLFIKNSTKSTS